MEAIAAATARSSSLNLRGSLRPGSAAVPKAPTTPRLRTGRAGGSADSSLETDFQLLDATTPTSEVRVRSEASPVRVDASDDVHGTAQPEPAPTAPEAVPASSAPAPEAQATAESQQFEAMMKIINQQGNVIAALQRRIDEQTYAGQGAQHFYNGDDYGEHQEEPFGAQPEIPVEFEAAAPPELEISFAKAPTPKDEKEMRVKEVVERPKLISSSPPLERSQIYSKWLKELEVKLNSLCEHAIPKEIKDECMTGREKVTLRRVMWKVALAYQPGGASERKAVLKGISEPPVAKSLAEVLRLLTVWETNVARARDHHLSLPDPSVQVAAILNILEKVRADPALGTLQWALTCRQVEMKLVESPDHVVLVRFFDYVKTAVQSRLHEKGDIGSGQAAVKTAAAKAEAKAAAATGVGAGGKGDKGGLCTFVRPKLDPTSGKCFNCGSADHARTECPAPKRPATAKGSDKGQAKPRSTAEVKKVEAEEVKALRDQAAIDKAQVEIRELVAALKALKSTGSASGKMLVVAQSLAQAKLSRALDSAATHVVRSGVQADTTIRLEEAMGGVSSVAVNSVTREIEGGNDASTLIPLGVVIEALGVEISWKRGQCFLKDGKVKHPVTMINKVPHVSQEVGDDLIARLAAYRSNLHERLRLAVVKYVALSEAETVDPPTMVNRSCWGARKEAEAAGADADEAFEAFDTQMEFNLMNPRRPWPGMPMPQRPLPQDAANLPQDAANLPQGEDDEIAAFVAKLETLAERRRNGHRPHRTDCYDCNSGDARFPQHRRLVEPRFGVLSFDLFGPVLKSVIGDNVYGIVAALVLPVVDDGPPEGDVNGEAPPVDAAQEPPEVPQDEELLGAISVAVLRGVRGPDMSREAELAEPEAQEVKVDTFADRVCAVAGRIFRVLMFSGAIPKKKATESIKEFVNAARQYGPVTRVHTDRGGEFLNRELAWFKDQGILQTANVAGDSAANGRAEATVNALKCNARKVIASALRAGWPEARAYWPHALTLSSLLQREPHLQLPAFGEMVLVRKPRANRDDAFSSRCLEGWFLGPGPEFNRSAGYEVLLDGGRVVRSTRVRSVPELRDAVAVPDGFPFELRNDPDGKPYYVHTETGQSQWTLPVLDAVELEGELEGLLDVPDVLLQDLLAVPPEPAVVPRVPRRSRQKTTSEVAYRAVLNRLSAALKPMAATFAKSLNVEFEAVASELRDLQEFSDSESEMPELEGSTDSEPQEEPVSPAAQAVVWDAAAVDAQRVENQTLVAQFALLNEKLGTSAVCCPRGESASLRRAAVEEYKVYDTAEEVTHKTNEFELNQNAEPRSTMQPVSNQLICASLGRERDGWLQAAVDEIQSLDSAQTIRRMTMRDWSVIQAADPKAELIPARGPSRKKFRIVACGNFEKHSEGATYSATVESTSFRVICRIGSFNRWDAAGSDVHTAFLNAQGDPGRNVCIIPPKVLVRLGLVSPDEVWLLTGNLYGLCRGPRLWGDERDKTLRSLEFDKLSLQQSTCDPAVWCIVNKEMLNKDDRLENGLPLLGYSVYGYICTHVDDIFGAAPTWVLESMYNSIAKVWAIDASTFLSRAGKKHGWKLSQTGYASQMLRHNGLDVAVMNPAQTPFPAEHEEPAEEENVDPETLRRAQQEVGALLWLANKTRPDLAFGVSRCASIQCKAPLRALKLTKHMLRYIAGTLDHGLFYPHGDCLGLGARSSAPEHRSTTDTVGYSDSSYAPLSEKSHQMMTVVMAEATVQWRSNRQPFVTMSAAECELVAEAATYQAALSITCLLEDLHVFTRLVLGEKGFVTVVHVAGRDQVADLGTKAVSAEVVLRMRALAGISGAGQAPVSGGEPAVQAKVCVTKGLVMTSLEGKSEVGSETPPDTGETARGLSAVDAAEEQPLQDDEACLLDLGFFGLTIADVTPPLPLYEDNAQEERWPFRLPPLIIKILLATGLLGATAGVIGTLAVQKLCRELVQLNRAWCPTRADPVLPMPLPQECETSGLFDAPTARHECRLLPARPGLTNDAEVQTERPWPPPPPRPDDSQSIWISGAGERFHLLRDYPVQDPLPHVRLMAAKTFLGW
ncbi:unnamed protein product [Polarella glacialis]|uniref:Copia protein n=1 Tax=Polarella glacialis TaxID=89957 RepID=A0A813LFT4_POLGL|nr:unnamed protein product [Polarella glacialis]